MVQNFQDSKDKVVMKEEKTSPQKYIKVIALKPVNQDYLIVKFI